MAVLTGRGRGLSALSLRRVRTRAGTMTLDIQPPGREEQNWAVLGYSSPVD